MHYRLWLLMLHLTRGRWLSPIRPHHIAWRRWELIFGVSVHYLYLFNQRKVLFGKQRHIIHIFAHFLLQDWAIHELELGLIWALNNCCLELDSLPSSSVVKGEVGVRIYHHYLINVSLSFFSRRYYLSSRSCHWRQHRRYIGALLIATGNIDELFLLLFNDNLLLSGIWPKTFELAALSTQAYVNVPR